MPTANYEEADDRGTSARRSSGKGRSSGLKSAAAALNSAALFDIVERLGVVDMVVDRVKGRLEEVDIDDLLDEIGDYLKRNPEVLVVALGSVTIAAGALVYLNKRSDRDDRGPRDAREPRNQGGARKSKSNRDR